MATRKTTFHTRIHGKMWRVHREKRKRVVSPNRDTRTHILLGETDRDKRRIYINPRLQGKALLEVALHEGIHAYLWELAEEEVRTMAKDLTRLLARLSRRSP